MKTKAFYDTQTSTVTYVVHDPATRDAVIVDPVLDLDPVAWRTSTRSVDEVVKYVEEHGLSVHYVLDTHAHADHLTGMALLSETLGARTGIGEGIVGLQKNVANMFNNDDAVTDGSQWDVLLADGQELAAGSMTITAMHTPGHTPACMSYFIDGAVYVGDALFMPDYGTGRCDFPGGSAEDMFESVSEKLYGLPDDTRVFVGHDYRPGGRDAAWETTIGASKEGNVRLRGTTERQTFVAARKARDAELNAPALIMPSLQVNMEAGRLPARESNGRRYLRIPLNLLGL